VTLAGATLAAPVGVQPVSTVPPLPPASPAAAPEPSAEPDVDADDEFPERPAGPSSTRRWFLVALLALAALGGGLAWYKSRPVMRTVPDLVGVEQGVALNQIKGDFADIESTVPDEVLAAGLVVRTEPTAGTRVEKGTTVHLFVSSGPAPRILEELKGLTVAEATAKLQAQGLVVEMAKPVFDENVPQDVVISWTVPASPALTVGGTVTKGTTIRLVASGGPAPRTVPNLKGKSLADATAALSGIGLVVAQGPDQFSTTVPPGEVMSQDPAAGKPVPRGGTVTLVLSKGPDLVTVPDLTGLDANGIKTALQNAGFTIGAVNGNPAAQFTGLSVGGKPASAGMKFLRGTKVDLFFNLA
jgi:serine/threonine-protein kinase